MIKALRAESGVGAHLQEFTLGLKETDFYVREAITEGLKSGMLPCLKKLSLSSDEDGRVEGEVQEALDLSGRGKGSGRRCVDFHV